jgi:hypothetical protein
MDSMKKIIIFVIFILILGLAACTDIGPIQVLMKLNPGIDTIEINQLYQDSGATATVGTRTLKVEVLENTVDITRLGVYQIRYGVTYREKSYEIKRYVHVIDETPPVLSLHAGVDTIFVGDTWIDSGVTVIDNSGESIIAIKQGEVHPQIAGIYEITYQATDSSGNTSSVIRIVTVIHR